MVAPPAAAIVIEPSPFSIVTLVPAVSVDTAGPDEPPISISPEPSICTPLKVSVPESCDIITALFGTVEKPVPPFDTGSVPVTPGVTLLDPSNDTAEVLPRLVLNVLAVAIVVAVFALPSNEPLIF